MIIYSVVLVIVTLTCVTLSLWYAKNLGDMLGRMANHAQKIHAKSVELNIEKRRADALLCQMMPREVAEQLKMNREVKAEHSEVKVKDDEVKAKNTKPRQGSFDQLKASCSTSRIGSARSRPNIERSRSRTARSRPSSMTSSRSSSATSLDSRTSRLAAVPWKSSACSTLCTG